MIDYKDLTASYNGVILDGEARGKMQDDAAKFVYDRFNKMSIAKQKAREKWQGSQNLYYDNNWDWVVTGGTFSGPVRFPTLRDTMSSLVDNFMQDPPEAKIEAKIKKEEQLAMGKKFYINGVLESNREKMVKRMVYKDMFFYGVGVRMPGYHCIKTPDGDVLYDGLATERIDPRDFFIDENAIRTHDIVGGYGARDCIVRKVMPLSTYQMLSKKFGWRTDVHTESWYTSGGLDYLVTNETELFEKSPVQVVKLYEYLNTELNLFIIVGDGKHIYTGTLKGDKGTYKLPIADSKFEERQDSWWGVLLAELIAPHIIARDTVFNLELMNLKLTLQPVLAVSGDFGYNKQLHKLYPGAVWQATGSLNGKIGDAIQPLIVGNPNTRSYEMMNMLNSELTVTARTDIRSLQFQENTTATQVLSQNRSMNAHNEQVESVNEVLCETTLIEIMNDQMQEYMEEKNEQGEARKVRVSDYVVVKNESDMPKFMQNSGANDFFELTQEMIDVDVEISVIDKRSVKASKMEQLGRMMQAIPMILNTVQVAAAFDQKIGKRIDYIGLIDQLVSAVDLDIDKTILEEEGEFDDKFESMKEEIILGHNVDIPEDEERDESMARLKYLRAMKKRFENLFKENVAADNAWKHTLGVTVSNITADHIARDKMKKEAEKQQQMAAQGIQLQAPQAPGQPKGQPPMASGPQTGLPTGGAVPQPDKGLLNLNGNIPS